jgi:hypothetical protein
LEPLTKVTLNLFAKDVEWFRYRYPEGYSEYIRDALRQHINYVRAYEDDKRD